MKTLILVVAVVAFSTSSRAETWTCTYTLGGSAKLARFEVSPPDLIETALFHEHYLILQDNSYGIVAVSSISTIEQGQTLPTVGAATVVINKETGEFWLGTTIAGQPSIVNQPVNGKCLRN